MVSYYFYVTEEKTEIEIVSKVTESINSTVNSDLNPNLFDYIQIFIPICSWRDKRRALLEQSAKEDSRKKDFRTLLFLLPSCSNKITWSP